MRFHACYLDRNPFFVQGTWFSNALAIETALITAPSRAGNRIFGRALLERLIVSCERAGVKRFFIETPVGRRLELQKLLDSFRSRPEVKVVDRFDNLFAHESGLDSEAPCIALSGNLVFLKSHLSRVLNEASLNPGQVRRVSSADSDSGGEITTGPFGKLLEQAGLRTEPIRRPTRELPFALNGRPEDREEAELRLARSLRWETADKDALMARILDRKLSWRISLRLARTRITPNQVTVANTALGIACGLMFAMVGYYWHLLAAILFLASITIDGVDGELARLQMSETDFGGKLDLITDNIVHVAIFAGIFVGVYRSSNDPAFLYLLPIQLGGFAAAAMATYLALRASGPRAEKWIQAVERCSGRDFAYMLVGFALIDRLSWFCWGTAFGIYVFAIILMVLTVRHWRISSQPDLSVRGS